MLAGELEIGVAASAAAAWAVPFEVRLALGWVLGGELDGIVDDAATALSVGVGALVVWWSWRCQRTRPLKQQRPPLRQPRRKRCPGSADCSRRRRLLMQRLLVRTLKRCTLRTAAGAAARPRVHRWYPDHVHRRQRSSTRAPGAGTSQPSRRAAATASLAWPRSRNTPVISRSSSRPTLLNLQSRDVIPWTLFAFQPRRTLRRLPMFRSIRLCSE